MKLTSTNKTGIGLALLAILFALYVVQSSFPVDKSDFDKFYLAGKQFYDGDFRKIYELRPGGGPFRYVPFSLLVFEAFALLPETAARLSWFAIQYGCLIVGMVIFFRTLKSIHPRAIWICLFSLAFSFRYWIDALLSGQTTGWMFLASSAGLAAVIKGNYAWGGGWITLPAVLKIAPGIFYFPGVFESRRAFTRILLGTLLFLLLGVALLTARIGAHETVTLFTEWGSTVLADSQYVKSEHINNQSLKGVLVRTADIRYISALQAKFPNSSFISTVFKDWWLTPEGAEFVWKLCVLAFGMGFVIACVLRKPLTARAKLYWFGLAATLFLVLNPTTFGYNGPYLTFSIACVLISRAELTLISKNRLHNLQNLALVILLIVNAVSGGELPALNFGNRAAEILSLPFLGYVFLAVWLGKLAWTDSVWRFPREKENSRRDLEPAA